MVQQGRCVGYAAIMLDLGGNLYLAADGEHCVNAETPLYIYPNADEASAAIAAWQTHIHDADNVVESGETLSEK
jgi:NADH:ubiquinone oxidoreductase subunit